MKFLISSLIFLLLGVVFFENNEYNKPPIQGLSSNYNVFIISEAGCMSCNKKYMNFILDNAANKKNSVIYSAASGMKLDISAFLTDTIKNVIQNDLSIWKNYKIQEGSYFINVRQDKVDTVIHILPKNFSESLGYIRSVTF